jgi:hypothetical protein
MPPELQDFAFAAHKEEFERQRDRTDAIRDRITYVVGFLTLVGGIIIYLISEFPHSTSLRAIFFYLPITCAAAIFLRAAYTVGVVASDRSLYAGPPSDPHKLKEFYDRLVDWGAANNKKGDELVHVAKTRFGERYRYYASHNLQINARRSTSLLSATTLTVWAFAPCILALPSFGYEKLREVKEPTSIRLMWTL